MKKNIITVILLATLSLAYGQSNTFPTTGNVGIGTSTPSEKLEINGDVKLMGVGNKKLSIYSKDTNGNGTVQYLNNSMNYEAGIFSDNQYGINAGAIRVFTIGTDGNVGLGTTGPQSKLDVNGGLKVTGNSNILYSDNKIVGWDDPNNYYIGHYPVPGSSGLNIQWYGGIKFGVGLNRNAMQILGDGNVGIGTSTPSEKLEINGDVKLMGVGNKKLSIYSKDTNGNGTVQYLNNSMNYEAGIFSDNQYGINAGAIRVFTIGTDGNVGIGTTNPQAKLDVNGTLKIGNTPVSTISEDQFLVIDNSGNVKKSNNSLNTISISEKQRVNARATGYAIIAAKNPGIDFSVYVIPWDGINSLEYNANTQINASWHPQVVIKGNFFHQPFDGIDFTGYSSFVTSQSEFDNLKSVGTQWWIVCSTLPSFSSSISSNYLNGNVSIKNKLEAKEVKVTTTPTADFVFAEGYQLPKLEAVEKHIKEKKHLPEIASAEEMEKEGVDVGEFQIKLLQKIEELTLYSIEQNKRINELESQNKELLELKKQFQILTDKSKK